MPDPLKFSKPDKSSKAYQIWSLLPGEFELYPDQYVVDFIKEICNLFGCQYTENQVREALDWGAK